MPTKSQCLAINLERARTRRGLSLSKFADFLGLSSGQAYVNYEKGRVPRNIEDLNKIANKLNTNVDALLSNPDATEEAVGSPGVLRESGEEYQVDRNGLSGIKIETLEKFLEIAVGSKDYYAVRLISSELAKRENGK